MNLRTKVLVVGGGPAGATAARFLARNNVDVILLERNPSFVKPCGGGIPLTAFEELEIPGTVIKKEVKHVKLVSPKNKEVIIELKEGSLAIVTRGEFDTALRQSAKEKGAKLIEGECVQLAGDRKMYRARVNIGEKKIEIVSEFVIAADGVNSRLRNLLGIKPCQAIFTVKEKISESLGDLCEFWFGSDHASGFYSWVFPSDTGSSFGTGTIHQGSINTLLERFKKRRGIKGDGQKQLYRIPLWKGDIYNKGRILFAGDSAGLVLPFAFEGIYYAMKAGELAAEAIIDNKAVKYKRMWKCQFQKRFILMDKLRDYFLKDDSAAEKLVALHRRQEVQDAAVRLWLRKDRGHLSLKKYIKLFRKFLS